MTLVKDVMAKGCLYVAPETPLIEAARMMRDNNIGFLPIGHNDRLIGVVTDRDIVVRGVAEARHAHADTVAAVMTPKIYFCFEDQPADEVHRDMVLLEVHRLPVVDRHRKLVGVISRSAFAHNEIDKDRVLSSQAA